VKGNVMTPEELQRHIFQINDHVSYDAKERYLFDSHKDVLDALAELSREDLVEYERLLDKLIEAFDGTNKKGMVERNIKRYIESKLTEFAKEKLSNFTNADFESLAKKNGQILPTINNFKAILLASNVCHIIWDTMTSTAYFTTVPWEPRDKPLEVTLLNGETLLYHRVMSSHNRNSLKSVLSNIFVGETRWLELDDAVELVAKENMIDLYQMRVKSIEGTWDGIDRINDIDNCFAVTHMGAKKEQWSATWCRTLMMNIIYRCFEPGCFTRYIFALEGKQNIGKTSFCRAIGPANWYGSVTIGHGFNPEAEYSRQTHSKVIIELPEGGGTHKADINTIKKMVTETFTEHRPMRTNDYVQYLKRSVMILTTNESQWLGRDHTGETRTLPLKSEFDQGQFFDTKGLLAVIPQIYAQAIDMYRNGVSQFITPEEFKIQEQETEKRDLTYDSAEYEIVSNFFANNKLIEEMGEVHLDLIYTFMRADYDVSKYQSMKSKRLLGRALEKHGFVNKGNKYDHELRRTVKKWWK